MARLRAQSNRVEIEEKIGLRVEQAGGKVYLVGLGEMPRDLKKSDPRYKVRRALTMDAEAEQLAHQARRARGHAMKRARATRSRPAPDASSPGWPR